MSNLALKRLRNKGYILHSVLPFARSDVAASYAERAVDTVIMRIPEAGNTGRFWAVSLADAKRLRLAGYDALAAPHYELL